MAMIISELKVVDGYGKSLGWVPLVDKNRLHILSQKIGWLEPRRILANAVEKIKSVIVSVPHIPFFILFQFSQSVFGAPNPRRNSDQLGINSSMGTTHQVCSSNLAKVPKAGSKLAFHEDHLTAFAMAMDAMGEGEPPRNHPRSTKSEGL